MNGVVALAHFCVEHGPSIVMVTQPYSCKSEQSHRSSRADDPPLSSRLMTYLNVPVSCSSSGDDVTANESTDLQIQADSGSAAQIGSAVSVAAAAPVSEADTQTFSAPHQRTRSRNCDSSSSNSGGGGSGGSAMKSAISISSLCSASGAAASLATATVEGASALPSNDELLLENSFIPPDKIAELKRYDLGIKVSWDNKIGGGFAGGGGRGGTSIASGGSTAGSVASGMGGDAPHNHHHNNSGFSSPRSISPHSVNASVASGGSSVGGGIGGGAGGLGGVSALSKSACNACNCKHMFLSNEERTRTSFVSCDTPESQQLYRLLKQAVFRSLTCEENVGPDSAVYFGNDRNGHVISCAFKLKDIFARGSHSKYSIIVFSFDRSVLLSSFTFLADNVQSIIGGLEAAALDAAAQDRLEFCQANGMNAELHVDIPSGGEPRGLCDVTGNSMAFGQLHQQFSWLLHATADRWRTIGGVTPSPNNTHTNTAGRPIRGAPEQVEPSSETAAAAAEAAGEPESETDGSAASSPCRTEFASSASPSYTQYLERQKQLDKKHHRHRKQQQSCDQSDRGNDPQFFSGMPLRALADPDQSNTDIVSCRYLRRIPSLIGERVFIRVGGALLLGDQIVIRSRDMRLAWAFAEGLAAMLPVGCAHIIESRVCEPVYKCNVLLWPQPQRRARNRATPLEATQQEQHTDTDTEEEEEDEQEEQEQEEEEARKHCSSNGASLITVNWRRMANSLLSDPAQMSEELYALWYNHLVMHNPAFSRRDLESVVASSLPFHQTRPDEEAAARHRPVPPPPVLEAHATNRSLCHINLHRLLVEAKCELPPLTALTLQHIDSALLHTFVQQHAHAHTHTHAQANTQTHQHALTHTQQQREELIKQAMRCMQYLRDIYGLIENDPPLPESSLVLAVRARKHEWMSKARTFHMLRHAQQLGAATQSRADRAGGEAQERLVMGGMFSALQVHNPLDQQMVRFFTKALRDDFKSEFKKRVDVIRDALITEHQTAAAAAATSSSSSFASGSVELGVARSAS